MFVFKKDQKSFDFDGITIGGHPGENPTVLVGGLFFKGQSIVTNTKEGHFDKGVAKSWIETGTAMAELTGHPLIIEAYGRSEVAMEKHLSWLADVFEGPFMFESANTSAKLKAIDYCEETGLSQRAIYNSVNLSMKDEEKVALKDSSLEAAVLLGWSPKATSLPERMRTIDEILAQAESLGIQKFVVDPGTMPVGAGYGLELRTTLAVKSELGLPTCLAPHNAPSAWKFIRDADLDEEGIHSAAILASIVSAQMFAADCIMFGSLKRSREVFTAVSLTQNAISTAVTEAQRALGSEKKMFQPRTRE